MGEISIDPKFNIHETYKKVRILNPYRNTAVPSGGGYLLDTYDAVLAYSTLKLKTGSTSPLRVENTAAENLELLFTDDSYSLSALVSDGRTLDQFRNGGKVIAYSWIDQTGQSNDIAGITGAKPTIVGTDNILKTTNGKPSIFFNGSSKMERAAIAALNTGNAFTVYTVSSSSVTDTVGTILSTSTARFETIRHFADTRSLKRNLYFGTPDGNFIADMSQVRTAANTPVLKAFSSTGNSISSWDNKQNGTQNFAFTGTYINDTFKLGEQESGSTKLDGNLQFIMIRAGVDDDTTRDAISTDIMALFNII